MRWAMFLLVGSGSAIQAAEYGADVSFPIHHLDFQDGPLGDRKAAYEEFMNGCREFYGKRGHLCDQTEVDRVEMSLRQAQSMVVSRQVCSCNLLMSGEI